MVVFDSSFLGNPVGTDNPKLGPSDIRNTKLGIMERVFKEHTKDSVGGTAALEGFHSAGSARVYVQADAPTVRPDGITTLNTDDVGRLWVDSDTTDIYYWDGDSWELVNYSVSALLTSLASSINAYESGADTRLVEVDCGTSVGNTVTIPDGLIAGGFVNLHFYGKKNATAQPIVVEFPTDHTYIDVMHLVYAQGSAIADSVTGTYRIPAGSSNRFTTFNTISTGANISANYYFSIIVLIRPVYVEV